MTAKSLYRSVAILSTTIALVGCGAASPLPASPSPQSSSATVKPSGSAREQFESTDRTAAKPAAAKPAEAGNSESAAPAQVSGATAISPASSGAAPAGQAAPGQAAINLGAPQQLFHLNQPDSFGMSDVPDQQPAVLQQQDGSYLALLNGRITGSPAQDNAGNVAIFSTKDFTSYAPLVKSGASAAPVFSPACENKKACQNDAFDADYVGANMVFRAQNGTDLLMVYNGTNTTVGGARTPGAFYAEIGIARSIDQGLHWTRGGAVVQGADPKPSQSGGAAGTPQPGGIIANGYIYMFYPYFPTKGAADDGPPEIQAARAPVAQDGAPGTWMKYYNGSFSQPGLRPGQGSQVVPNGSCKRPVQPSVAFSSYLNQYVMTFLCEQGWFASTSPDLVNWANPIQFFVEQGGEFQDGQPTDENVTLVTPSKPAGVIDQTGLVLYSNRPSWGHGAGEFWMRSFMFGR